MFHPLLWTRVGQNKTAYLLNRFYLCGFLEGKPIIGAQLYSGHTELALRMIEYFILYSGHTEMALRKIEYFILYSGHMELAHRRIEYFILYSGHTEMALSA